MAKIAVDIDDTLYSFGRLARQVLSSEAARTGDDKLEVAAYAPWSEWRVPPDLIGIEEWLRIIDLCHTEEQILSQEPYPDAYDVLHDLVDEGHELVYVTSRNPERQNATEKWVEINGFPVGPLACSGHDKTQHIKDCQYIIDDRVSTLVRFVYDWEWTSNIKRLTGEIGMENSIKYKRIGFGLMTEYNRGLTDCPGIFLAPPENWVLLRKGLVKHGVLSS